MNRAALYRRAIRKDREKRAKERHAPMTNDARVYQSQLAIFDTLMKFAAELDTKGLKGQQRARYADHLAAKTTKQIAGIWNGEAGGSDE